MMCALQGIFGSLFGLRKGYSGVGGFLLAKWKYMRASPNKKSKPKFDF